MITLSCGQNTISIAPCTKITKFIRQVTQRFTEVEQVLEQAEEIGLQIKRRPYSEHIDEIAETGLSQIEAFGFALFIDGKLIFQPDYQVLLVGPVGTRGDSSSINADIENRRSVHSLELVRSGACARRASGLVMQLQSGKSEMFKQKFCFKLKPFKDLTVGLERHYLVNGFIPRVGTTVIWGKPKTGKTFMVSDLVMRVAAMPPYSRSANIKEPGHLLQSIVALVEMRP
jgi:hypothetical protein